MKIVKGKEQEYADWKAKNDDPYSARCFSYAEDWADLLEKQMAAEPEMPTEKVIEKYADSFSHLANTDGITGFMYGMAVSILSEAWIHGEPLRRWHNLKTQIGDEGVRANEKGTVLNPAILNIG
jgi:hypothetical protein